MIHWKKGIYYVFVTGSGVKIYTKNDDLETLIYVTEFGSFYDMLNYFKNTNTKYELLNNKWDIKII